MFKRFSLYSARVLGWFLWFGVRIFAQPKELVRFLWAKKNPPTAVAEGGVG